MELVYLELRRIATRQFRRERTSHILQPTALVNEAYLRLAGSDGQTWDNRAHFFAAAAETMRRVLVDHARGNRAQKRGAGRTAVTLDEASLSVNGPSINLLALDEALTELARLSPRQARLVELRYFGGLSVPETAHVLGINPRTVDRDWAAARAWLRRRLQP
jgi:RNA polymerase sigma-70 factor (ECF subfamily)